MKFFDPTRVSLFGTEAIVHVPNALMQLIQHTDGLQRKVAGFRGEIVSGYLSGICGK